MGLRQLAGVGHHLPTAAAQLHRTTPDPFGAARFRTALPPHEGADARRSPHRPPTTLHCGHERLCRYKPEPASRPLSRPATGDVLDYEHQVAIGLAVQRLRL